MSRVKVKSKKSSFFWGFEVASAKDPWQSVAVKFRYLCAIKTCFCVLSSWVAEISLFLHFRSVPSLELSYCKWGCFTREFVSDLYLFHWQSLAMFLEAFGHGIWFLWQSYRKVCKCTEASFLKDKCTPFFFFFFEWLGFLSTMQYWKKENGLPILLVLAFYFLEALRVRYNLMYTV